MLAVYMPKSPSILKKADQMYVLDFLSSFLQSKNYGIIYLSASHKDCYNQADAIVCYDVSSDYFHQIGDRNFVPLLALDSLIADNQLFFQVNTDYGRLSQQAAEHFGADYTLLLLDTPNLEKKALLEELFPSVSYISEPNELPSYTSQNLLVIQHVLNESLKPHMESGALLYYAPVMTMEKAEALFSCMEYAMERTPAQSHNVQV